MQRKPFPVIDPVATGQNILRLRRERGLSVRDLQAYFGFEEPQAIYKWQRGKSLPSVDHLYALSALLEAPMDEILVRADVELNRTLPERRDASCRSDHFWTDEPGRGVRRLSRPGFERTASLYHKRLVMSLNRRLNLLPFKAFMENAKNVLFFAFCRFDQCRAVPRASVNSLEGEWFFFL